MASRTRMLIGIGAATLAWMLGYGMGGGFRATRTRADDFPDAAGLRNGGAFASQAAARSGLAIPARDTLADQVAGRRVPRTRDGLRKSIEAIGHERDIVQEIRFALKFADQLGVDDFPLVIEVADEARGDFRFERPNFREMLFARWAELKPEAAAEYLKSKNQISTTLFNKGRIPECEIALAIWGESNPAAALKWAKTLGGFKEMDAMRFILRGTVRRDMDLAIAVSKEHIPERMQRMILSDAVADALFKQDPEQAARAIASLGGDASIRGAAYQWAKKDATAALRWAEELPQGATRAYALDAIWPAFADQHPDEAAAVLSELPADGSYVDDSANRVARNLAQKDLQRAEQWAAALQHPEAREEAFGALGFYYARNKPDVVEHWLGGLASGPERDSAIRSFINEIENGRPASATAWAATIQDDKMRGNMLRSAFKQWCYRDLAAAFEWVQTTNDVSEQDRQAMLTTKD